MKPATVHLSADQRREIELDSLLDLDEFEIRPPESFPSLRPVTQDEIDAIFDDE